ncbi:angiopoietin-2-like [Littorina saxatilis]|uniref:angiopoietin-2-like n=1 Tax=Littorina saxatilis TaxID=31220 RepID=UPI0038B41E0E
MLLLCVCVVLWSVVTVVSDQRSLSFIQHSSSFLIAPASVVKCRNQPWCTSVFCATSCLADLSCRSISVKVTGSDECLHHNVTSSDPSASVTVHSEWVTYDKAVAQDCTELGNQGWTTNSGVYSVYPFSASSTPVSVFCQLDSGHWWTVIEKRADDTLTFSRPLAEFIQGFGSPNSSHWLGECA